MAKSRKNEAKTDIELFNYIKDNRIYSKNWTVQKQDDKYIQEILDKTSKKGRGNHGYPDLIYVNDKKRILILIENKDEVKDHISENEDQPISFAVDGIKHYLSFFTEKNLLKEKETIIKYLKDWKIIGIAFSGDIKDAYKHRLDTYIVKNNLIVNINKNEMLDEEDYISFFNNIDLEQISKDISKSSSEINRLLRNLDSQKRPILLSALMICLYPKESGINFKDGYSAWDIETIITNIPTTIKRILKSENISEEKVKVLTNELMFIETDKDLNDSNILKDILKELEEKVIPLFQTKTSYDIIGKFYEEFLRYAGITNVKKGIVLTPNHITTLFTDLIDIKNNDVIFDPTCGTGAFLIAGMNKLIDEIENSNISNKKEKIKNIKSKQLIGFEKNSSMYSLAISNMLFRGDGKSQIFNEDFFSDNADEILQNLQKEPTIGFINPPYGGTDNTKNPTKKEIQFLEKMLDNVSRYGIIIAPLSTYFKDDIDRNRILTKHTLKYVINMPTDLFQPNASTHTAIAIFETNLPHNNKEVVFYDLKDDGFILSKTKGRTDVFNKWNNIKKDILTTLNKRKATDNINSVITEIKEKDEWIIQAHSKTDYKELTENNFNRTVQEYSIFRAKLKLDLIEKNIDDITLLEIFNGAFLNNESVKVDKALVFDKSNFKEFDLCNLFTVRGSKESYTKKEISYGEYLYITTSNKNNGVSATSNIYTEDSNIITIDSATDGKAFYQAFKFVGSDHVEVLEPINFHLNKYIALFITTILNLQLSKYGFGRKRSQKRIKIEKIFLPYIGNSPDFEFMENYIKSLSYSSNL
jgi:type I restriction-modification system DNA methylase subunit